MAPSYALISLHNLSAVNAFNVSVIVETPVHPQRLRCSRFASSRCVYSLLFFRPPEINKMDEKVGVGGVTWQYNVVEADRKAADGSYWTSPLPNSTWINLSPHHLKQPPPPPLHSRWPLPLPCSGGRHFIKKRPRDGAAVTKRTIPPLLPLSLPSPPSSSAPSHSWCAFCLVPNDSCDGTVMLCDHTGRQPGCLYVLPPALHCPRALRLKGGGWGCVKGLWRSAAKNHAIPLYRLRCAA